MKITKIKKNDIFLARVDTGSMPPARVKTYLESVKNEFKKNFDNKVILIAGKSLKHAIEFEILREE